MFPFLTGDEYVVLVLALLARAVPESRDAITVLPVREPLTLVPQTVTALTHTETCPLVVLPFSQVGLCYASV